MDKRESFAPPAVGGSCLLVIFAVLCLTVFALLSLSTAQANDRLADASVEAVSAYYQADRQAETILAQLRSGQMPQGVTADGATYIYIYIPVLSPTPRAWRSGSVWRGTAGRFCGGRPCPPPSGRRGKAWTCGPA